MFQSHSFSLSCYSRGHLMFMLSYCWSNSRQFMLNNTSKKVHCLFLQTNCYSVRHILVKEMWLTHLAANDKNVFPPRGLLFQIQPSNSSIIIKQRDSCRGNAWDAFFYSLTTAHLAIGSRWLKKKNYFKIKFFPQQLKHASPLERTPFGLKWIMNGYVRRVVPKYHVMKDCGINPALFAH